MDQESLQRVREEEDTLIDRGMEARGLMESPCFLNTVARLSELFSRSMFATEPHESKKREGLYYQALALQAIVDLLAQDVQIGEHIARNREEPQE